jgi:hypothetical protein
MFVTTPRASAWLDPTPEVEEVEAARAARGRAPVRTLYATRSFFTAAGRCVALKLVPAPAGSAAAPRLFVLVESRLAPGAGLRWVAVERVLTEDQAARWAEQGFCR